MYYSSFDLHLAPFPFDIIMFRNYLHPCHEVCLRNVHRKIIGIHMKIIDIIVLLDILFWLNILL